MSKTPDIYILAGPEAGEKNSFIKSAKDEFAKAHNGSIDEYNFYPYDTSISDVISILRNIPLFSAGKFVVLKNCEELKKKDLQLILDYVKNPSADSMLILVTDGFSLDAAIEKQLPKDCKKVFWEISESQKKGWIAQFFNKQKIEIESAAVAFLADVFGSDSEMLKKECANIALFFSPGEPVTSNKIADFFYNRKDENIFSLFGYVAEANLTKAAESAKNIILSGESDPARILSGLLWQIKNLYEVQKLLEKKYNITDIFQQLRIRGGEKAKALYLQAAKNYSIENVEKIISLTAFYSALFRSVNTDLQNVFLPVYFYSIITSKGKNFLR